MEGEVYKISSVSKERTVWVDVLKGVAIMLVVIGHSSNQAIHDFLYCFHMPLFFILSGFLFSPKPIGTYVHKSILRLAVPYISFMLLTAFPSLLCHIVCNDIGGGKILILRCIYGGEILCGAFGVFWFISVLWFSVNLFNLIVRKNIGIWLLPIIVLLGYVAAFAPRPFPLNIQMVPMATAYLWIGYLFKSSVTPALMTYLHSKKLLLIILAIITLICVYILRSELTMDMKYADFGSFGLTLLSSVFASVAVALIAISLSTQSLISKILCFIGMASMVIMYIHLPVKFIILSHIGLQDNFLIAVLSGIILSLATYALMRCNRLSRALFLGQ